MTVVGISTLISLVSWYNSMIGVEPAHQHSPKLDRTICTAQIDHPEMKRPNLLSFG